MVVLRKEFKTLNVRYRHDASYRFKLYDPYTDRMYENVVWDPVSRNYSGDWETSDMKTGYGVYTDADLSNCEISRVEKKEWVEVTFSL